MVSNIHLSPYVNFQGRAREALEFYHKVLGGNLDLLTSNQQGVTRPAGPGDRITHARLETNGALIVASDGHPDYPAKVGDSIAIALSALTGWSISTRHSAEEPDLGVEPHPPSR